MRRIRILYFLALLMFGLAVNASALGVTYVGGHMTFTFWEGGPNAIWGDNIDVVNVWEVTQTTTQQGKNKVEFRSVFTSLDVGPDYDGIPGLPMTDGPFMGYSASFDFNLTQQKTGGDWSGDGRLTMYDPLGNLVNPDSRDPMMGADQVTSRWNGFFGEEGEYTLNQRRSNYFQHWEVTDIVTYQLPGLYTIPTNDILYETEIGTDSNGELKRFWKNDRYFDSEDSRIPVLDTYGAAIQTSDLILFVPAAIVPEPSSVLLLGSGLMGLAGLRVMRKK